MQKDKDIKMLAIIRIMESDNTTKDIIKLLKFVKESTTDQIKGLLLYGKMMPQTDILKESVNSREVDIVFERLISEAGGRIAKLRKSYMSQYGAGGGLNPFWLLYRKIRSKLDACTKRCGTYELNTTRRQHCMLKCKLDSAKAQLAAAKKSGDEGQIKKAQANLAKTQNIFNKSLRSFSKRGAEA